MLHFLGAPRSLRRGFSLEPTGGLPSPPVDLSPRLPKLAYHFQKRSAAPAGFHFSKSRSNAIQVPYFSVIVLQIRFQPSFAPNPAGGAYDAPKVRGYLHPQCRPNNSKIRHTPRWNPGILTWVRSCI